MFKLKTILSGLLGISVTKAKVAQDSKVRFAFIGFKVRFESNLTLKD